MRILFFHHATTLGGAPNSLALLISKLAQMGVDAFVAMPKRSNNLQVRELFVASGACVVEEQNLRPFHGSTIAPNEKLKEKLYALGGFAPTAWAAKKIVSQVEPDIVHLNSTSIVAAAYGARWVDGRIPVVAHVREPILSNAWGGVLRRLNQITIDHYISIDNEGVASVGAQGGSASVIRNSVDPSNFEISESDREKARRELGWAHDVPVVLSLSRMTEANGALALAQAIARIERRLSCDIKVVFAGFNAQPHTPYESAVLDQIDLTSSCLALPFTENVHNLLAACDAIIAPFLTNHSSRSVFEGGAAGRPAIVSRVPNLTELIVEGATGLSYDIADDESLVAAIETMCNRDKRAQMGFEARRFARQHFDAGRNAASVLEVYRELAKKGRAR